ncbi:unnamed protein product [Prorocentrum cordatum]|uniref:Uncharacterized protein n=1 Tax=Prorocentrum cordatum TaxID=2364126 RepID=A0ABN9VQD0_9DINO|nr:unnamed protein product [Polarella glacialis]
MLALLGLAAALSAAAASKPGCGAKHDLCASFTQASECSDESWTGQLTDLFLPDDTCEASRRYIDARGGALEVSASGVGAHCNETWGRRFDPETHVNPVLEGAGCERQTSFASKVPRSDPLWPDVQKGALNFTLKLGTAGGCRVIMWNGPSPYNGRGGDLGGRAVPPSSCDNFWLADGGPAWLFT